MVLVFPHMAMNSEQERLYLEELSRLYPTIDAALARVTYMRSALTLRKGSVHVISDVHGEFKKLKHILNNASGSLRPLIERTFDDSLSEAEKHQLLTLIYYPRESFAYISEGIRSPEERLSFIRRILNLQFELLRQLAQNYTIEELERTFPEHYRRMFSELLFIPQLQRGEQYLDSVIGSFIAQGKELDLLRLTARVIRNLLIAELIIAGDLGDRGPRIDRVIDYIMRQPRVTIVWGNHDASWLGACFGHAACIANVLRFSLRYGRVEQIEEGYGITLRPLVTLARALYADDPCERFHAKADVAGYDALLAARMQKAIAILQFKLEGQLARRNPQFGLEHRNLLHRIDRTRCAVEIEGTVYPLLDQQLPSVAADDPYRLSGEEQICIDQLRRSFMQSALLWQQMRYVAMKGAMWVRRDHNLIFHACVPVDERGEFMEFPIDGEPRCGRELFDAFNRVVQRAFRHQREADLDLLWYLWGGPLSPWFGKDKMATFEGYFVADPKTHVETKNPYFKLIHDPEFCRKILREFGIDDPQGLIVNGHVPVKIEHGESPLKRSGLAVTIDGAFSEAYGDKGYSLVLDSSRTYLAQHHHFESISDAITSGADIIPTIQEIRVFDRPRVVGDTERGEDLRVHIELLEKLIAAYRENIVRESL